MLLPACICNQTCGDQQVRGRGSLLVSAHAAFLPGLGLSAQVGICVKAAAPAKDYIFLQAGLTGETLGVYKGQMAADSKHSFIASVSPLGRTGICSHPYKGEQPDPPQSHRAPQCAGSEWAPAATGTPGCAESQAKGHPMGWGTAEGMWQLTFGSKHVQAPLTWKSVGQGALGFSKTYHPAVALQGNFVL